MEGEQLGAAGFKRGAVLGKLFALELNPFALHVRGKLQHARPYGEGPFVRVERIGAEKKHALVGARRGRIAQKLADRRNHRAARVQVLGLHVPRGEARKAQRNGLADRHGLKKGGYFRRGHGEREEAVDGHNAVLRRDANPRLNRPTVQRVLGEDEVKRRLQFWKNHVELAGAQRPPRKQAFLPALRIRL